MFSDLWFRLRALLRRGAVETELDDELAFHLERAAEKHLRAGHGREEAMRLARLDLGGVAATKEDCREASGVSTLRDLAQDVRYGLRVLRKSPGFTAVAVLTLTLGIGANTALFSVVNGVLLHPLPYPDAAQLVRLHASRPAFATGSISYPNFRDWQRMNRTFSAMAVSRGSSFTLTGMGNAEKLRAQLVTADFFPLLGVTPRLGRNFAPGEDERGAPPLVILGAGFWQRRLGGAPDVVGQRLMLDGRSFTVVGVLPAVRDLPGRDFQQADVFVPIGQWDNEFLQKREAGLGLHGIGRLKPGVTLAQARADLEVVSRSLAAAYPDVDRDAGAVVLPLEEAVVGGVRPTLLVLLGAVGFVLLIACVNVANLLLARSSGRARELAIRLALGATRGRLLRQMLTESVLLALAGGALGVLVAAWGTHAVLGVLPETLPRVEAIGVDPRVLLFSIAISLAAGVLFGLPPAIKAAGPDPYATLKQGGRGASGTRHRAQGVLVVLETALALVLLVGAGLMVRTLSRLWSIDPGFEPSHVMTFVLSLPPSREAATPEAIRSATREIQDTVAATPGVEAMSLSWGSMPMDSDDELVFWPADRPRPANLVDLPWAVRYIVGPGYLDTLRVPLLRGRFLAATDDERAPSVVVVDDVFARTTFPGEDVVGKRIHVDGDFDAASEIVGVVGHVRQWGLDLDDKSKVRAQVYQPFAQLTGKALAMTPSGIGVLVRGHGPALLDAIRARVQAVSTENVMFAARPMDAIVARSLADRRFTMFVLGAFAALALVLASIGIYGVISYLVSQRTHEIGIRMALGARRVDVLRLVIGQGAKLALVGVAIGVVAALGLTRLMGDLLFGVPATDPWTFAAVAAGLTLIALAACYLPARRALRVDPMRAMRHE